MPQKTQIFLSSPLKIYNNGQQIKTFLLLPLLSKIAVIKIEAHTKRTEPEYQGNALAGFHAKAALKNL